MDNPQEYRSSMQSAALAFLLRHQGEHLVDDGQLFERANGYLVNSLEVPAFMAPRLVHLAMSELSEARQPRLLGVDLAAGADHSVLVLFDRRSGERVAISRRILPSRFLASHSL
jgi:hypothetical protein